MLKALLVPKSPLLISMIATVATLPNPNAGLIKKGSSPPARSGRGLLNWTLKNVKMFLVEIGYDFSTNNILTFFNVQLSNPRPDLAGGEDPFLIKPALGLGSVATVAIIDINSGLFGTNNAFNIERAFYRVDEDPSAFVLGGRNSFPTSFGRTIVSGTGILGQEGQTRNLYIDVMLLPRGGPGTVQVFVF